MKLYELKLVLLFEQQPELRASIRELSIRAGLNYRSAYETATRFAEKGILSFERFGQVKVCSFNIHSEEGIAALAQASLARWLLSLGKGPLVNDNGNSFTLHIGDKLSYAARRLSHEPGAVCLLALWSPEEKHHVAVPKGGFSLHAVASESAKDTVQRVLSEVVGEMGGERHSQVHNPQEMQDLLLSDDKRQWLVLMGHERFWRIVGGGLS